jgi:hypothetical protein
MTMKNRLFLMPILLLLLSAAPARAEDCAAAYESSARPYMQIVNDILTYKVMFDNYDRLCSATYPKAIAALQPDADRLREQVKQDAGDAAAVVRRLFRETLPRQVPPACHDNKRAAKKAQKNLLAAMKARSRTLAKRLGRSGKTLPDPKEDLKLCAGLPDMAPAIRKALGPDLAHPLLEMSALNSKYITGESGGRARALADYRAALAELKPAP